MVQSFRLLEMTVALTLIQATTFARGEGATPANDVIINFSTTGSVVVDFTFQHAPDAQHFCTAAAGPWAQDDVSSGGAPAYEVRYDAGPRRASEHFHMRAAGYQAGATAHSDPANDWIDFWADGDEWLGHGKDDPAFKLQIEFAPDGSGGTFKASHLRAARDGKIDPGDETVDVKGEWHCPVGASVPAVGSE
jgi:hypothetical protein